MPGAINLVNNLCLGKLYGHWENLLFCLTKLTEQQTIFYSYLYLYPYTKLPSFIQRILTSQSFDVNSAVHDCPSNGK